MSAGRWHQVWKLFEEAIEQPPEARSTFLDQACSKDQELRRTVAELLDADREVGTFFDSPPLPALVVQAAQQLDGDTGTLTRGTRIGPYRILRRIGQGGMGTVYLAVRDDDTFLRRVVIKLVRSDKASEPVLERLRTERQILASLEHPNIARLFDGGSTESGAPYFVLEYVEGERIDAFCKHRQLSIDERLDLFRKVCAAVHYAHQNLVVHRDLKPSNILVMADGEPKLLDFGIAKVLNPELVAAGLEPTATWERVLTPNYASPEQLRGKLITTASDVYSLGVLLYKLLTGHLPRELAGHTLGEIEQILTESDPPPPSVVVARDHEEEDTQALTATGEGTATAPLPRDRRPEVIGQQLAGDLDAIVLKTLRSAPQLRYGSAEGLAADIERYQRGLPVEARAGNWRYRAAKWARRNRRFVVAAAGTALLLIGFAVAMALQASRIAHQRDQARLERDKKAQVLSLVLDVFASSNPFVLPGEELTVRDSLERSVPLINAGLKDQPAVRAALLHTSGTVLEALEVFDVARDQLAEALAIRRRLHGEDHPEVAETLSVLASAYKNLDQLDKAEALARRAVEIARGLPPSLALDLTKPLNELVSVLCYRGEYQTAQAPAEEALALTSQLPGNDGTRATTLELLARVRAGQGDRREAVRLNREALALHRARLGEQHPQQLPTLNNLAVNLRRLGELEAAAQTLREAIDLHRASFGADHQNPNLLSSLGGALLGLGDFAAAEALFQQALEATLSRLGPEHPDVLFYPIRIAQARIEQGDSAAVEAYLRQHLASWRTVFAEKWRLDLADNLLGEAVSRQGRCAEAEPLLTGSFERLLGRATSGSMRRATDNLRQHFERCGKPEEMARFEAMLEATP